MNEVPRYNELFNPVLDAIQSLGGSAQNNEITQQVIKKLGLSNQAAEQPHKDSTMTELEYRLTWSRTYLKQYGVIENSSRGVWSLTDKGHAVKEVVSDEVVDSYRRNKKKSAPKAEEIEKTNTVPIEDIDDESLDWKSELYGVLTKIEPDGFERLCQRLLRESGFIEVEVTGKSGDGGIDGHGLIRLAGLISFPVMFQCKRYQGNVSAGVVRDFRGAMQGRAEKGLILTTGSFTPSAREEATRDGAPPIDLIDGDTLVDLLKDLSLGVTVTERTVEEIKIVPQFFDSV